jgi:hypothetical protein
MPLMLSEKLGPWITALASSERICRYVVVQKLLKLPLEVSQVPSGSFQISKLVMPA